MGIRLRVTICGLTVMTGLLASMNIASAHVTAEPQDVLADSYQKLSFKVTHGCEGSATKAVIINIPEALHGAKPMPKLGWAISLDIKPLSQPYNSHGRLIKEEVRTVTWQGGLLPNEYFDEFSIHVRVSSQIGQIAIPVTQLCESGRLNWNEVVTPEKSRDMLEAPAPVINIFPNAPSPQHQH